jgi:hypothetical protein
MKGFGGSGTVQPSSAIVSDSSLNIVLMAAKFELLTLKNRTLI